MAITLTQSNKIDLGGIVAAGIQSVREVRVADRARTEAEFQKAIADGTLSYSAQIRFREEQLKKEKSSGISDPDYIIEIQTSIGSLKKLQRYQTIRDKYKTSLDQYVAGKGNINQVINILEGALEDEQDPQIRNELQTQLSSAISEKTTIERNAIQNRITVAEKDKSIELIDQSIKEVKEKKSDALMAKDKDTAAMWDATLSSLNSTRAGIQIDRAVSDINYKINRENLTSGQKLGLLGEQVNGADRDNPVVYGGVRYDSMADFWNQKQSEYINNNYLTEVASEIEAETNRIAQVSSFGQVPVERIEAVSNFYKELGKRSEFAPFADQIEQQRVDTVSKYAVELQTSLADEGQIRVSRGEDPFTVEANINKVYGNVESKFGIKLARPASPTEAAKGGLATEVARAPLATDTSKTGALPTVPGTKPATPSTSVAGQMTEEEEIAAGHAFSVYDGRKLGTSTPAVTDAVPTPKPAAAPAPAPTPTPAAPTVKYAGSSIRDFLASQGKDSSYEARKKIALEQGIKDYSGTAEQNTMLLTKLNV